MSKRMTDTNKWDDPWFLDLPGDFRLVWIYLLDKCDHSGIWKVNKRLAEFIIGSAIKWDDFLSAAGARILPFSGGEKWFISKFIDFQYGTLQVANRVHFSVIEALKKEGLYKALISPLQGVKEKEKEKEKDNFSKTNQVETHTGGFDFFWKAYPKKESKGHAEKVWNRIHPGKELTEKMIAAIEVQKKSDQWRKDQGQFIPHPATWLNGKGWENEIFVPVPEIRKVVV